MPISHGSKNYFQKNLAQLLRMRLTASDLIHIFVKQNQRD